MSVLTGNGLNTMTDIYKYENIVAENPQEVKPNEIIHKHEVTVRIDIDHLLNQIEKHSERIDKLYALSEIE
jgi:hypothetical protein